jgi:S-adenosylmethionine hydrolase
LPTPKRLPDSIGWQCPIIAADHYGNLALGSCQELLSQFRQSLRVEVETACSVRQTAIVVDTYGQQTAGQLIMLIDSQGRLELAQVNGSAAKLLNVESGEFMKIWPVLRICS